MNPEHAVRVRTGSLVLTLALLAGGAMLFITGNAPLAHGVWLAGVIGMGAPLVYRTIRGVGQGRLATDVVATLAIVGAVVLGQPLAGLVIVLMQTGGEALERFAEGRASAAVRELEAAAPRVAHVVRDGGVEDIAAADALVDDTLLIKPGDLVPCDGIVVDGESELDTSSLTGEVTPLRATAGTRVLSGMLNAFGSFRMRVTASASGSQYARIVELVRTAQASKSPMQRMADRYAVWFTPITITVCAIAVAMTHDWNRALAILVVATPCPLILAMPVAIIGGINRAAKRSIIIRTGAALEQLGHVNVAVFDKTGTITIGKPRLRAVRTAPGFARDAVMRYAASVEDGSSHLLARVLVEAAKADGARLAPCTNLLESPGQGVSGIVEGHAIVIGARGFVIPQCDDGVLGAAMLEQAGATLRAYVGVDGHLAAVLEFADEIRAELPEVLHSLERAGVSRVVLLSGDHAPIVRALAAHVGIGETYGDLLPGDKAQFIERLRGESGAVMMVGDGTNDAPALTTADVGIAMAAHGGGITAEAADVIVLIDSLDRVTEAMDIGRRTMKIARQSIRVGLGLSAIGMVVAAFGRLPPIAGAGIQELIDVAVILNALRASAPPHWPFARLSDRAKQGATHSQSKQVRLITPPSAAPARLP